MMSMRWSDLLAVFTWADAGALAVLWLGYVAIGWRIEHPSDRRPSVSILMQGFRREWMQQMVTRQPRIFDAHLLGTLRQGTAFFASASMIAIGGGLALIGNTDPLAGLAEDLTLGNTPPLVWEIKILAIVLFQANAFLKYVWAHRLFGYCAVAMAAVPNEPSDTRAGPRSRQAAELNITAARSFNRGMRATYFALAACAWLVGPTMLALAALVTVAMLWRREFASHSRSVLLSSPPAPRRASDGI